MESVPSTVNTKLIKRLFTVLSHTPSWFIIHSRVVLDSVEKEDNKLLPVKPIFPFPTLQKAENCIYTPKKLPYTELWDLLNQKTM